MEATFAFVDPAGFSALTEVHGDEEAALLLDRFEHLTVDALGVNDRLVKMIGDAAMICFAPPRDAVAAMQRLERAASFALDPGRYAHAAEPGG